MVSKRRKLTERKLTVADAVSEAYEDLSSLGEEMREAYDNTPESLQQSGVGEARGEAADNLENLSEPDVPEQLQGLEFTIHEMPLKAKASRATRRDQATTLLDQVISFLNDKEFTSEELTSIRDDFVPELEALKDDAEAVEFPGMYG